MFSEGNDVSFSYPNWPRKSLIYQAAPVIDASFQFSTGNRNKMVTKFLCRPLKLSQMTRCTILAYLGQEDGPPTTFGLFANDAAKLLN